MSAMEDSALVILTIVFIPSQQLMHQIYSTSDSCPAEKGQENSANHFALFHKAIEYRMRYLLLFFVLSLPAPFSVSVVASFPEFSAFPAFPSSTLPVSPSVPEFVL